ncbi:uncharacterized protein [Drosophila bipectinata]|uniref:uncharacterized protein isoform X1 n=1 Tax=Drosophila bipectinata TaxID=42026 RepID=UPI001C8ADF6F|nr:uncharacterized protein LOC108127376 [Drosophila bipectinata]
MSSEIFEDTDLIFAEHLDDSQPSISLDQSMLEDQELQLQKGLEDMEKESSSSCSSSYSYKPSTKKRKAAADESCALTQKFTEYVDLHLSILSQTKKVPLVVTYWGEIMKDLPEEMQDQAEQHITKFLLDLKQKAKYHE